MSAQAGFGDPDGYALACKDGSVRSGLLALKIIRRWLVLKLHYRTILKLHIIFGASAFVVCDHIGQDPLISLFNC